MSHKALSSAALLRGRPDGVVVNTSALESRGPRVQIPFRTIFRVFTFRLFILSLTGLKSQCHPKCFARRGTFFKYENSPFS